MKAFVSSEKLTLMQATLEFYALTVVYVLVAFILVFKTVKALKRSNHLSKSPGQENGILTIKRMEEINKLVSEFLAEKKPFLQPRYSIAQLSGEIQIPQHQLSSFINSYYKMNYNDLINKYRVYYSKIMMLNEEWKFKTLQGIAIESGFGNRTTFSVAFKKVTGLNPSEFIKTLKEGEANDELVVNKIREDCIQNCPEMKMLLMAKQAS